MTKWIIKRTGNGLHFKRRKCAREMCMRRAYFRFILSFIFGKDGRVFPPIFRSDFRLLSAA
ncbi:hypothetical protein [Bartonella sp. CL45QHWL]|uniref:hypothetical protein n=1 Tax=Bartonella sp. CL45QHWL TaxID=3243533 RepID=UPI0035CE97CD